MTLSDFVKWFCFILALAPVVILVVYLCARAGAFAWFRTKREHMKKVLNDLQKTETE